MNADWAADAALEGQMLAMTDWTCVAFLLAQMAPRFAGSGSVLTAASRQAGGMARTDVMDSARLVKMNADFIVGICGVVDYVEMTFPPAVAWNGYRRSEGCWASRERYC